VDAQLRVLPTPAAAASIRATLEAIAENQRAYEEAGQSCWRFIPYWLLRRQHALCKANEPLFAQLGIRHPPFFYEDRRRTRGLSWWVMRRLITNGG